MKNSNVICRWLSPLLCLTLLSTGLMIPAQAQNKDRVIIVNADQPNVWTLEQAHYLLAQMHRRNLDLKAKRLEELDPNEINGLRFDVLRQLIEFGATFNQADQLTNQMLARNKTANSERRLSLTSNRDKLRAESLDLTRQISQLQSDKAKATSQEEKDRIDADIAAKTALRDKVDKEVAFDNDELKTLGDGSGNFKATDAQVAFDATKLPKSTFDKAFEDAAKSQIEKFNQSPELNATLKLENFLQMQYEIVAKQLTLLRDEVGPGERLLFLELPQTVNVTYHEADKKWAQSWWRIVGYTKKSASDRHVQSEACTNDDLRKLNCRPVSTSDKVKGILEAFGNVSRSAGQRGGLDFVDLEAQSAKIPGRTISIDDRSVRTVELVPRQSSLNVNDMKLRTKAGAFSAVASFLFGFGARLNIQRQREQFSQFVQQELYSSAFGKGSREFGWTFTPMPGTDRLQSGVRTTYAVVVVPEEATSLIVESNGCYFSRTDYQPNDFSDTNNTTRWGDSRTRRGCGNSKAFVIPVPGSDDGSNGFWVQGISFQPVPRGKRIVVLISGSNFSSQIGALVNGVPLIPAIGLAQPLLRDDSQVGVAATADAAKKNIQGTIERVDANKLVCSFEMPADFQGTPTITLIAPGKAIDINWLSGLNINETQNTSLIAYPKKMFGSAPDLFRMDGIELFRLQDGLLRALIHGGGFKPSVEPNPKSLFINGVSRQFVAVSPELIEVNSFTAPADDMIQATLVYDRDTVWSAPVANPGLLRISKVTILSFEAATDSKPGVLVARIEGTGFPATLEPSDPKRMTAVVTSATELLLTIKNPEAVEVVTLTDPATKISVRAVITRPTAK